MKTLKLLSVLVLLSFALCVPALAQITDPVDPIDLSEYFVSLGTVASAALLLTSLITKNIAQSTWKQVISWAVAIALAFVGDYFELGIFAKTDLFWTIAYGIAAGLVSNGIFDIKWVQAVLTLIGFKKPIPQ